MFDNPPLLEDDYEPLWTLDVAMKSEATRVLNAIGRTTKVPDSTLVLATLTAGLAQSVSWVPEDHVEVYAKRIIRFNDSLRLQAVNWETLDFESSLWALRPSGNEMDR